MAIFARLAVVLVTFALASVDTVSAATVTITPNVNHPSADISVTGTGFGASEAVDIYFDTTDVLLVVTSTAGKIVKHKITVPATAAPGEHWITAIGRRDGDAAQRLFTVRTEWAQFGFTARAKRTNPYENVLTTHNVSNLDVAWRKNAGFGIDFPAVVANGAAFYESGDGSFHAVDALTAAPLWSVSGEIYYNAAYANGTVYVATFSGKVHAYNATTGVSLWTATTGGVIAKSPVIANGNVYVGAQDGSVYALDATTGALVWSKALCAAVNSTPAVANGVLYTSCSDNKLYALDATTGIVQWASPTGIEAFASPSVANGQVYIGSSDNYLDAINITNGSITWRVPVTGRLYTPPALDNGIVYAYPSNNVVYAVDPATGATVWTTPTGASPPFVSQTAPVIANGVLYAGAGDGRLYALNAVTGAVLWSGSIGIGGIDASAVVSDGMVYLPDGTYLYALALNGGENAIYNRHHSPPSFATLRPDRTLRALP